MFFSKAILFVVSLAAISVMATPHALNHIHHRAIAARAVSPPPQPPSNVTIIARAPHRKRQNAQKCRGRTSTSSSLVPSSAAPTSSISPQPTPTPAQHQAAPVTTPESSPPPASQQAPTTASPSPTPTPASQPPAPTTSQPSPSPTTTPQSLATPAASSGGNNNGFLDGTNSGDITFYAVGLGACGQTSTDNQLIVAVSIILFNSYPGYTGGNPNDNPVCGKQIEISYGGNSVTVTVLDACEACAETSLDLSTGAFDILAAESIGRLHNASWKWV